MNNVSIFFSNWPVLDGFIAGPNAEPEKPLGEGGERLHEWVYQLESWRERHGLQGGENNKDVSVMGGANVIQQYLKDGLLDEIQIHLVPVLLGAGNRLFDHLGARHIELASTRVIGSSGVTHLRFRVVKERAGHSAST